VTREKESEVQLDVGIAASEGHAPPLMTLPSTKKQRLTELLALLAKPSWTFMSATIVHVAGWLGHVIVVAGSNACGDAINETPKLGASKLSTDLTSTLLFSWVAGVAWVSSALLLDVR